MSDSGHLSAASHSRRLFTQLVHFSGRQPGSSCKAVAALFVLSLWLVRCSGSEQPCVQLVVQFWLCSGPRPAYEASAAMLWARESSHAYDNQPWP